MDLQKLFYPLSIAVIGASSRLNSVGNDLVKNLLRGYKGQIFPVNPKDEPILGLTTYSSVLTVPGDIDLAVIVVPASIVPLVLEEVAQKKIPASIVISAGFKETGEKGLILEKQLQEISFKNNIALIGPNSLGVINPEIQLNASFSRSFPKKGNIAFLSQSGALCAAVLDYAEGAGMGFSKFVSTGNKAVIDEISLLNYLGDDKKTKVILMYVEAITNGPKFLETAQKVIQEKQKPIIVLKAGKTSEGAMAVSSHTGALAGNDAAYEALFIQSGIIRAHSLEQLFDMAQVFSFNPFMNDKRVAVITNAGGPGILVTDEVVRRGLRLANFSEKTTQKLKNNLPPEAVIKNPIDILGDAKAERYQIAINTVLADENVDGILVLLTPQSMTEINQTAEVIAEAKKLTEKPVLTSFMGASAVRSGIKILENNQVANILFPESAAKGISALYKFGQTVMRKKENAFEFNNIDKEKARKIIEKVKKENRKYLLEPESLLILKAYNFPVQDFLWLHNEKEAVEATQKFYHEVALKIISPDILHKTEVGGVLLNVKTSEIPGRYRHMLHDISNKLPNARLEGVLVTEMVQKGGYEFVIGSKKDSLGQLIMFGLGGIYVELLKDIVFRLGPLTQEEASRMIDTIKSSKLFQGFRGKAALDKEKVIECLGRLSTLLFDFPEIKELDINPLLVYYQGQGVKALDARIILE